MLISDPMAVANAAANALDAAFGGGGTAGVSMALPPVPALTTTSAPTRVLVLLNMVMDEDLATDDDHKMLEEEVREEVSRYGKLISMKIPRPQVSILFFSFDVLLYVMRHLIFVDMLINTNRMDMRLALLRRSSLNTLAQMIA